MNTTNILANIISFIHGWILSFVILVPLIGDIKLLLINTLFMFIIMLHWYLNNNICALTLFEKILRGKTDDNETFFGQIFGKIYSVGNNSKIYWIGIFALVLISLIKIFLYDKWELVYQRMKSKLI